MHYFITGASGYIGGVVAEKAIAQGATVHGLSRTEAGDAKLKALGAVPIRGDLTTLDTIRTESSKADAVIHCAFVHDWSGATPYDEILRLDREAVDAIAEGIKGTNKALVVSCGCAGTQPDPNGGEVDEDGPLMADFPLARRYESEVNALEKGKLGIRVSSIRLAPFVYGRAGSGFLPMMIKFAAVSGQACYVGEGNVRTTSIHVEDAATMYLAAAKSDGGVFNGSGDTTITNKAMAEAVGKLLEFPARSVTAEEAMKPENLGPLLTMVTGLEVRASNRKAREVLGWKPEGVDLLTDTSEGSYKELAKALKK